MAVVPKAAYGTAASGWPPTLLRQIRSAMGKVEGSKPGMSLTAFFLARGLKDPAAALPIYVVIN